MEPPAPAAADFHSGALQKLLSAEAVIRRHEPLAKRTTLRVGGPAELYAEPANEEDLAAILRFGREYGLPSLVLGRGSNLLVKDQGVRGVVICLAHPRFSFVKMSENRIHCGAGARLKAVAIEAKRYGVSGFEFLEGIPGSVGGALRMNAGAMGRATFDIVESVRLMDMDGNILGRSPEELGVSYRSCPALKSHVALSAVLRGEAASREIVEQLMNDYSHRRWASQPAAPSAGCIFKNPLTIPAGKLIDELGLKGMRVGGAIVSAEHGNFIVNEGDATAKDVLELIAYIQECAWAKRAIQLETEVEIIGE
jgi:UDP-N-acetylenolpyruvoylglucosamine reductase